jgi:hypothetical protein
MSTTKTASVKQRIFSDYQRMLTFTINLCYKGRDFRVITDASGYTVRYW